MYDAMAVENDSVYEYQLFFSLEQERLTRSIIDSMNVRETRQISYKEQVIKQLNRAGFVLYSERRRLFADDCSHVNVSTGLEILFLIK